MLVSELNKSTRDKSGYYSFDDVPGKGFPSVTTILKVVGKPSLINWAAKVERELVIETATSVYKDSLQLKDTLSPESFTVSISTRLGQTKSHERKVKAAGDIGTKVHHRVEWEIAKRMGIDRGEEPPLSGGARTGFANFLEWYDKQSIQPVMAEQVVRSMTHGYAGTMDLLAVTRQDGWDVQTVIDWKTSSGIYFEAALQVAAYRAALREMGHIYTDDAWAMIVRLPKVEKDRTEVRVFSPKELEKYFEVFLAAKKLWEASMEWEDARK